MNLRPLLEGNGEWRKTLGVESEVGRMVINEEGYKYIRYFGDTSEEQLLDLNLDPYETKHFTNSTGHSEILSSLRNDFDTNWFN